MTLRRVWMPSPNHSPRSAGVRLVVIHTAEGALTIEALGNFFASSSSAVSSHVGIDDKRGTVGEYVKRDRSAWTQAGANSASVSAELCAFAAWDRAEWDRHPAMLLNCAEWIAEECRALSIPIRRLSPAQAQGGEAGVCGHVDLGSWGGNHWDPGPGFPMDDVIAQAATGTPAHAPKRKGRQMIAATESGEGYWTTTSDGAVYAFGDAQFRGGANSPDISAAEIIGIAGRGNDGYWLFGADGGVFAFGSAQYYGRPDRA